MQIINLKKSALIEKVYECEFNYFFGSESYNLLQLKNMFVNNNYFLYGLMDISVFAGYFFAKKINDDECEIEKIFVKEEYRNKKNGSLLLTTSIENINSKKFFLEVRSKNKCAISFYEKNGFTEISRRKNYYSDGETAIILKKEVD